MTMITLIGIWPDGGPALAAGLPVTTAVQIDWPRGTDDTIDMVLVDRDGQPVDLAIGSGDSATLAIRTDITSDVVVSAAAARNGPGSYTFSLASNATIDLAGFLVYDVWAVRSGSQRQVVSAGYFNITPRMIPP